LILTAYRRLQARAAKRWKIYGLDPWRLFLRLAQDNVVQTPALVLEAVRQAARPDKLRGEQTQSKKCRVAFSEFFIARMIRTWTAS
jgi:hypothetical protein